MYRASPSSGCAADYYSLDYQHPQWEPDGFVWKIAGHPCYDPVKDLIVPLMKTPNHFHLSPLIGGPTNDRTWLAFHRGRVSRACMPALCCRRRVLDCRHLPPPGAARRHPNLTAVCLRASGFRFKWRILPTPEASASAWPTPPLKATGSRSTKSCWESESCCYRRSDHMPAAAGSCCGARGEGVVQSVAVARHDLAVQALSFLVVQARRD